MTTATNNNTTSGEDSSPSHARRKALRDADVGSVMKVISTYPIEKYYNAADRLFVSFQQAFDDRRLDEAYVLGVRFASFSLESLPRHASYKSKFKNLRLKNARHVEEVFQKVESLTERMDAEEKLKLQQEEQEQQKRKEEQERVEQEKLKKEMQRMEKMQKEVANQTQKEVEDSAKAKLSKLAALMNKDRSTTEEPEGKRNKEAEDKDAEEKAAARENLAKQEAAEAHAAQQEAEKQAAEEAILAQERKLLAEQAEKLDRQRKEQLAREEMETNKLLMREVEQAEKEEAEQIAAAIALSQGEERRAKQQKTNESVPRLAAATKESNKETRNDTETLQPESRQTAKSGASKASGFRIMANLFGSSPKPKSKSISSPVKPKQKSIIPVQPTVAVLPEKRSTKQEYRKPTGIRPQEERTIELLRQTIVKQEARLKETEEVKIPMLLRQAKGKLSDGDRKGAAGCVARKRRLVKDVEMLKGAIFTMETQILLLDSAVENREVSKAMKAATVAMESLQVDVSDVDVNDMNRVMDELAQSVADDVMLDEDDLLRELEGSYAENESELSLPDDSHSMLSLPLVPDTEVPTAAAKTPDRNASGMMGWL